jgi:hypothetical protein
MENTVNAEQNLGAATAVMPELRRSPLMSLAFLAPAAMCGVSYFQGGIPAITDLGMELLTVLCCVFLLNELLRFPKRFGIGGLLLFGGVLVWICHDYCQTWLGVNFQDNTFPTWVVAKTAFWDCVYVEALTIGLQIRWGVWLEKLLVRAPEPTSPDLYFRIILLVFGFGIIPYFVFTNDFGLYAMLKACLGSTLHLGQMGWNITRTGNLNYSWSAYVAQWLQVGEVAGILAAAYAIFLAPNAFRKIVCWLIWLFYLGCAYESGRRGWVGYVLIPVIAFLFIRQQVRMAELAQRFSLRAYVVCGTLLFLYLVACQIQGAYRNQGLSTVTLNSVLNLKLTGPSGNSMFSGSLAGFQIIGEEREPFYSKFPGEGLIRLIPDQAADFFIQAIPRALWHDKPIDEVWAWYNTVTAPDIHDTSGTEGTTVSHGPAGHWYFPYGPAGVIEGGIFIGWLMGICERALRRIEGRLMSLLVCLGFATWLFLCYRDYVYLLLYPLLIGIVAFVVVVKVANVFSGRPSPAAAY